MKRHFMESLKALCAGVMTLCVASLSFVSCYDDSALNQKIDDIDARLKVVEEVIGQLDALSARVDALYTLKFQVTADMELQYSFDNGTTWVATGVTLAEECEGCKCPPVSLKDNGDSVTITVGDQSFTIEKPEEIFFEIRAGKLYFASEGTQTVAVKTSGVEDLTVIAAPKGWYAEINADGMIEVTAPNYDNTQEDGYWNDDWTEYTVIPATAAASGYVKVHACGADGKCMVGRLPVEVSNNPLVVNAYSGNYYINCTSRWTSYYYGISPKETYKEDAKVILDALKNSDYGTMDTWKGYGSGSVSGSIAEFIGKEPKVGEEYVVYVILEYSQSFDVEDLVIAYYSPINVSIVEDESKRTAFNIDVTISVQGADSYIAMAMPYAYMESEDDVLYQKEQMTMALTQGQTYGKLYTEDFVGSLLDVAEGTQFSMTGNYSPSSDFYMFVLPIDGRPVELYTADDVVVGKFRTSDLAAGGTVDCVAEPSTKGENYMGEFELDEYTQLGVKVTQPQGEWISFYYSFMTADDYAVYSASDAILVEVLLENYPMSPSDMSSWYIYESGISPNEKRHFVGFFVDKDGKYGKLAKVDLKTKELVKSDITVSCTSNLVEGVLVNTTDLSLQLTPTLPASKYKYVWQQTNYYNPYEGLSEEALAEQIHFATYNFTEVTAADVAEGLVISEHEYNSDYFLAILPYDEEGNPGKVAYSLEYTCMFALSSVETENLVAEPTITFEIPAMMDGGYGQSYFWADGQSFMYSCSFGISPAEGTEVAALLVDSASLLEYSYDLSAKTPLEIASDLWAGSISGQSYYTCKTDVATVADPRSFYADNTAALTPVILVSWVANGTYYYKSIDLSSEFATMYAILNAKAQYEADGTFATVTNTPDSKQWVFFWSDMNTDVVLDFGLTAPGSLVMAYDAIPMGAPEGTPFQMYNSIGYNVVPANETCGLIEGISYDIAGDKISALYPYYNLTTSSCDFGFETLVGVKAVTKTPESPITIDGGGIAM